MNIRKRQSGLLIYRPPATAVRCNTADQVRARGLHRLSCIARNWSIDYFTGLSAFWKVEPEKPGIEASHMTAKISGFWG